MLWLSDALRGDLGTLGRSRARRSSTAIAKAIPVSLQLMLYARSSALLIAIPAGVYAAYRANRRGDRVASTVGARRPLGPELRPRRRADAVLRHRRHQRVRPPGRLGGRCRRRATCTSGESPVEHFKHMALPTIALALGLAATVHARAAVGHDLHAAGELHHHRQGEGRARPADPLGPRPAPVVVHAADRLRPADGDADRRRPRSSRRSSRCRASARTIGTAIFQKDFLVVQGVVVVIAVGFVLINFLVDLLYAVLDPRVRHVRA